MTINSLGHQSKTLGFFSRPRKENGKYDPFGIILVQESLGGDDYWVTFRGVGDRMSSTATLIGVVQQGVLTTWASLPVHIYDHLQNCLEEATASWQAAYKEGSDSARIVGGPLAYLPTAYKAVATANNLAKEGVRRFFILWSRKNLDEMIKEANELRG